MILLMVNWRPILRLLLTFIGGTLLFLLTKYLIKYKSISSSSSKSSSGNQQTFISSNSSHKRTSFKVPKRIVCSTRNILISDGECHNIEPIESSFHALHQLLNTMKGCDIYFITHCENDETENYVVQIFDTFLKGVINPDKILFCSTYEGRIHMARHIEPDTYIDDDIDLIKKIKKFIPQNILVNSKSIQDNVMNEILVFDTLKSLVDLIIQSKVT